MREEDTPVVTDEVVEVDWALRGVSVEVWGSIAQAERFGALYGFHCGCSFGVRGRNAVDDCSNLLEN